MYCEYIRVNNEKCKHKYTNQIINDNKITLLCTRHFNKLSKDNNIMINIKNLNNNNIKNINYDELIFLLYINNNIELLEDKNKSCIYKIINLINNKNTLEYEYKLLKYKLINNKNIIKYNSYIITDNYGYVTFNYINYSYDEFKNIILKKDNIIEIIKNIYTQLLNVIKYIHSKKLLYLYLNPDFLRFELNNISTDNNFTIKIIDFTNCIQYINNNSEFYENDKLSNRHNNDTYGSRNINLGYRGIRFDDFESILYILLDLLNYKKMLKLKEFKQISRIIDKKNKILNTKFNIDYIDNLIDIINKNINCNKIDKNLPNKNAGIYFK